MSGHRRHGTFCRWHRRGSGAQPRRNVPALLLSGFVLLCGGCDFYGGPEIRERRGLDPRPNLNFIQQQRDAAE